MYTHAHTHMHTQTIVLLNLVTTHFKDVNTRAEMLFALLYNGWGLVYRLSGLCVTACVCVREQMAVLCSWLTPCDRGPFEAQL